MRSAWPLLVVLLALLVAGTVAAVGYLLYEQQAEAEALATAEAAGTGTDPLGGLLGTLIGPLIALIL